MTVSNIGLIIQNVAQIFTTVAKTTFDVWATQEQINEDWKATAARSRGEIYVASTTPQMLRAIGSGVSTIGGAVSTVGGIYDRTLRQDAMDRQEEQLEEYHKYVTGTLGRLDKGLAAVDQNVQRVGQIAYANLHPDQVARGGSGQASQPAQPHAQPRPDSQGISPESQGAVIDVKLEQPELLRDRPEGFTVPPGTLLGYNPDRSFTVPPGTLLDYEPTEVANPPPQPTPSAAPSETTVVAPPPPELPSDRDGIPAHGQNGVNHRWGKE